MRRKIFAAALLCACLIVSASAHDLFLKFDTYFLRPFSKASVRLMNGTFQRSDGAVARDRMQDVSLVTSADGVSPPQAAAWHDEAKTTVLEVQTGAAGTYVLGVSTKHREIDLKAAEFNQYLAHDGIPDTLAARKKDGELGKSVRERYSKHIRAIFQVGDKLTEDYKKPLNYPVEIIPQQNPYSLRAGQTIKVRCTLDGQPLVNQFVLAGWEAKRRSRPVNARTDADGIARFKLVAAGKWYVKLIHMRPLAEPGLNYESKWASLTFEIR